MILESATLMICFKLTVLHATCDVVQLKNLRLSSLFAARPKHCSTASAVKHISNSHIRPTQDSFASILLLVPQPQFLSLARFPRLFQDR